MKANLGNLPLAVMLTSLFVFSACERRAAPVKDKGAKQNASAKKPENPTGAKPVNPNPTPTNPAAPTTGTPSENKAPITVSLQEFNQDKNLLMKLLQQVNLDVEFKEISTGVAEITSAKISPENLNRMIELLKKEKNLSQEEATATVEKDLTAVISEMDRLTAKYNPPNNTSAISPENLQAIRNSLASVKAGLSDSVLSLKNTAVAPVQPEAPKAEAPAGVSNPVAKIETVNGLILTADELTTRAKKVSKGEATREETIAFWTYARLFDELLSNNAKTSAKDKKTLRQRVALQSDILKALEANDDATYQSLKAKIFTGSKAKSKNKSGSANKSRKKK